MNNLFPNTNGHISPPKTTTTRKLIIFSGGSAANNLVDVFNEVINNNACSLTYLIPISDNGGSSSELIRVFGGPGIGDIRSKQLFLLFATYYVSFMSPRRLERTFPGIHQMPLFFGLRGR